MMRFKVHRLAKSIHALAGISVPVRTFTYTAVIRAGEVRKIPDNFYDEELEIEKEFDDIRASLLEGGVDKLTVTKHINSGKVGQRRAAEAQMALENDESDSDLEEDLDDFEKVEEAGDEDDLHDFWYSEEAEVVEDEKYSELPNPILNSFIPATSSERYLAHEQGLRACPGKLQRRGRFPKLDCHLIDLDELSYLDVVTLKEFMSDDGEILPKTATGLCSKCQRQVAKTIKTARNFALLPHIGNFELKDSKPQLRETRIVHDASPPGAPRIQSKSLL